MKFLYFLLLVVACALSKASAFVPRRTLGTAALARPALTKTNINIGDQEREKLTRDSEPEDYFKTNTDKMTDQEKLPIALAGIAFIVLPFLAGMIALYAAKLTG